ncbi:MAG: hypothetical protein ACO24D_13820, partial [bacterium]
SASTRKWPLERTHRTVRFGTVPFGSLTFFNVIGPIWLAVQVRVRPWQGQARSGSGTGTEQNAITAGTLRQDRDGLHPLWGYRVI